MANEATPLNEELAKRDQLIEKMRADLEVLHEKEAVASIAKALPANIAKADELAADLRTIQKVNPDLSARMQARITDLQKRADAVSALTARVGSVGKTASADAPLEKAIAPLMAQGMTREAAITKAITTDSSLYEAR